MTEAPGEKATLFTLNIFTKIKETSGVSFPSQGSKAR